MMKNALAILAITLCAGCTSPFYKASDGIVCTLGVQLPQEEMITINAMNYLSGQQVKVLSPAKIKHKMEFASTNEYFWGMVKINEYRTLNVHVVPTNMLTNCHN